MINYIKGTIFILLLSCPSCYKTNKTSCDICGCKSIKSVDTNIYILECSNQSKGYKYYVGKTNNPQ